MTAVLRNAGGRKLDDELDRRITDATWQLLAEKSLASLTISEIAETAGTSRPTVYRRWNSVEEIVIDAFLDEVEDAVMADLRGHPPDALREYITSLGRFLGGRVGRIMAEILGRAQNDPELMERFHADFLRQRRDYGRALIQHGQRKGFFRSDLDSDLIIDLYAGPLYFRAFARHAPINDAFTAELAEVVLIAIAPASDNSIPR
ncbi:TetR/AcrR family transcriptional regulator [Paracoccus aerodenitrificans]|uniref:TetR/AcrR family transcriptional regulator n=1 Tax=Paracoccus aerodenitrificans TaxID=3017781 RepID=UPI0022F02572|nr:TetR/AcrR family transcriptional regulator [Paracoccus aerodenitrificans]WBU64312.1 TetR/AcrR family transcriptional regulator [Paracoccus aerodenitrificans]